MTDSDKKQPTPENESQRIKKAIVKAASKLFEEKGLYQTSVGEIAEMAGVSVPTAYSYVRRKPEIMLLIMEDFTNQFKEKILPQIEHIQDPKEKLILAMDVFYHYVSGNTSQTLLVYRESKTLDKEGRSRIMSAELEHVKTFQEILEDGVKKGVFKPHECELLAYDIIMLGHTWALKKWHFKNRMDLKKYVQLQSEFILAAIT